MYKIDTLFYGVDLEYSAAIISIFTGYLAIVYQRIHYKGQESIELHQYDTKLKQFARFAGRFAVMFLMGSFCFWLFAKIIPKIQTSAIGVWEIYFLGTFIPYAVGAFLVFAFGDFVCLKLKLYDENPLVRFDSKSSVDSYEQIKIDLAKSPNKTPTR